MKSVRNFRFIASLFLLTVFSAYSSIPIQSSLAERLRNIDANYEFNQVIRACTSEYLVRVNPERTHLQLLPITKTFFDNPSFFDYGNPKASAHLQYNCRSGFFPESANLLEKIGKLQI